ncbi:hypothetical protein AQJ27_50745 [Streptomyces olivochromogenes]|nr:hypothetical protein AQJ27_50745 [Streptomyces olivochromogenes]
MHRTVAGFCPGPGATAEHGPRGSLRIERVRLPEQTAGSAIGPVHFIHLDVLSQQVARQARSEGPGTFHTGPAHLPQLAGACGGQDADEQAPRSGQEVSRTVGTHDDDRRRTASPTGEPEWPSQSRL